MDKPNAETIFCEARQLPPAERAAFIQRVCTNDASLIARIEGLLEADVEAGSFMGIETVEHAGQDRSDSSAKEQPGQITGRYKLLQVIGEGGFGEVWMADQELTERTLFTRHRQMIGTPRGQMYTLAVSPLGRVSFQST